MLRRPAEKKLINYIVSPNPTPGPENALVIHHDDVFVTVAGIQFPVAIYPAVGGPAKLSTKIRKYCSSPCVEKVITVTVALPSTSCGCVEEWAIKLKHISRGLYDLKDIRPTERVYTFDAAPNSTPTNTEIKDFIVAAINSDKSNEVVALSTGADTFTITGKGCRNFDAYLITGMGSIAVATLYQPAVLTSEDMYRLFPVRDGFFGHAPLNVPTPNAYCKYTLTLVGTKQDLGDSQGYINFTQDVEIYVNQADPLAALLDAELQDISLGGTFA